MSNHSSGPWRVEGVARIKDVADRTIAHVHAHDGYHSDRLPQDDNAALIAAAPCLLAACEAILLDVHQYQQRGGKLTDKETHHVSLMRTAVAKAKGGNP